MENSKIAYFWIVARVVNKNAKDEERLFSP